MQIGFERMTSGNIRARVYMGKPTPAGSPTLTSFDWDVVFTQAQWIAMLTAVYADGAHAGTLHLESLSPTGVSAGALSPKFQD